MATSQPPDPRTFESWEDAFQYPLPIVRRLEQQLRKNIDDNRSKLRSLVGASYRDLLGTAEKIIEMDAQMRRVEGSLSEIARKCNAGHLEKVGRWNGGREGEREGLARMAQMRVLEGCLREVLRVVRGNGEALGAAKVLVLGRLLVKSLGEGKGAAGDGYLEELRRRLGVMRKKLMAYVDRVLRRTDVEKEVLAGTLCAYALTTSSGPQDVIRHFLQTRLALIANTVDEPSESSVVHALDVYGRTVAESRALFPKGFTETLTQLSKAPLLQDRHIRAIHSLSLDIYGQYIPVDVRSFTPWVRHEQVSSSDIGDALTAWSKEAHECILGGLRDCVKSSTDGQTLVLTRKRVLLEYLTLAGRYADIGFSATIREVRKTFMNRLRTLAKARAHAGISALDAGANAPPVRKDGGAADLWSLATRDFDSRHGAAALRRSILQQRHGRDQSLQSVCDRLDGWMRDLEAFSDIIQQMRSTRWIHEVDFDVDEVPDSEQLLEEVGKQEPEQLRGVLREQTAAALKQMYEWAASKSEEQNQAAALLRLLRELDGRRRLLVQSGSILPEDVQPDGEVESTLHRWLAKTVALDLVNEYSTRLSEQSPIPTTLWDGSPALPVQPTPRTYGFLDSLHQAMAAAGQDLWTPKAVEALKSTLSQALSAKLSGFDTAVNRHEEGAERSEQAQEQDADESAKGDGAASTTSDDGRAEDADTAVVTDGERAAASSAVDQRQWRLQFLFDVLYLLRALERRVAVSKNGRMLDELASSLTAQLKLGEAEHERLEKSASEYWKRTYLLFGLLAPGRG